MGGLITNLIGNWRSYEDAKRQKKEIELTDQLRQALYIMNDPRASEDAKHTAADQYTDIWSQLVHPDLKQHRGHVSGLLHGIASGMLGAVGGAGAVGAPRLTSLPEQAPGTSGIGAQTPLPGLAGALAPQFPGSAAPATGPPRTAGTSTSPAALSGEPGAEPGGGPPVPAPPVDWPAGIPGAENRPIAPDQAAAARALPLSTGGLVNRVRAPVPPSKLAGGAQGFTGGIPQDELNWARAATLLTGPQGMQQFQQEMRLRDALRRGLITPQQFQQGMQSVALGGGDNRLELERQQLLMRQQMGQQEIERQIAEIERDRPRLKAQGMTDEQINEMENKIRYGSAAPTAAGGTSRLTTFQLPDGSTVDLEYDPKTHIAYDPSGKAVTLPSGTTFAEPEAKGVEAQKLETLYAAYADQVLGQPGKKLTKTEKFEAQKWGKTSQTEAPPGYEAGQPSVANPNMNPGLEDAAMIYLETGKMPALGLGGSQDMRARIVARAGEIRTNWGLEAGDVLPLQTLTGEDRKAFGRINLMDHSVGQLEGTLQRNMGLAKELSDAYNRSDFPKINSYLNAFKTGVGDTEALALATQLHGVAQEWAKIMEGGAMSAAGVHVTSAAVAEGLISAALSKGQLNALFDLIQRDANNRRAAIGDEKQKILDEIQHPEKTVKPPGGGGGGAGGGGTDKDKDPLGVLKP